MTQSVASRHKARYQTLDDTAPWPGPLHAKLYRLELWLGVLTQQLEGERREDLAQAWRAVRAARRGPLHRRARTQGPSTPHTGGRSPRG